MKAVANLCHRWYPQLLVGCGCLLLIITLL